MLSSDHLDTVEDNGNHEGTGFTILRSGENGLEIRMHDGTVGCFEPVMSITDEVHAHLVALALDVEQNGSPAAWFVKDGVRYQVSVHMHRIIVCRDDRPDESIIIASMDDGRRVAAFKRLIGMWLSGQ